jgi:hypothetical protein
LAWCAVASLHLILPGSGNLLFEIWSWSFLGIWCLGFRILSAKRESHRRFEHGKDIYGRIFEPREALATAFSEKFMLRQKQVRLANPTACDPVHRGEQSIASSDRC